MITWWAVFSTMGGAIVGSIIGGTISYVLQKRALQAAKEQRDADRFETRKALALSLFIKMIRVASDLHNLGKAVKECFDRAEKLGLVGAPFQIMMPVAPLREPIRFLPEELALVLSIDAKLFNEMGALDELHSGTVALFDLYGSKRTTLLERFGATMEGEVGTTGITEEQRKWLEPRAVELNGLVEAMRQRTEHDVKEAWAALENLRGVLEREFKVKLKMDRVDNDRP
jgi:hypothetical protein